MLDLQLVRFIVTTRWKLRGRRTKLILVHTTCLIYIIGMCTDHFRVGASTG